MTQTAFNRDNVLTNDDRLASARKCLSLLAGLSDEMSAKNAAFVEDMHEQLSEGRCSERQLMWLRDLVEKHAL